MKMSLIVTTTGYTPADEEAIAIRRKYHKAGALVTADVKVPRNGKFQRKYFALMHMAFDYWEQPTDREYKGRPIEKNFERFRHDVTIMAGFYEAVWNLRGEMRLEPKSVAFDRMAEEDFDTLYNATIDVLLKMVLDAKGFSRADVDKMVSDIMRFDS